MTAASRLSIAAAAASALHRIEQLLVREGRREVDVNTALSMARSARRYVEAEAAQGAAALDPALVERLYKALAHDRDEDTGDAWLHRDDADALHTFLGAAQAAAAPPDDVGSHRTHRETQRIEGGAAAPPGPTIHAECETAHTKFDSCPARGAQGVAALDLAVASMPDDDWLLMLGHEKYDPIPGSPGDVNHPGLAGRMIWWASARRSNPAPGVSLTVVSAERHASPDEALRDLAAQMRRRFSTAEAER